MAGYGEVQKLLGPSDINEFMEQWGNPAPVSGSGSSVLLPRFGLSTMQELAEERCSLFRKGLLSPDDLVKQLAEEVKAAQERDSAVSNNLNAINRRYETYIRKEEMLQERSGFEAHRSVQWKRLYSMRTLDSYNESEEIMTKRMKQGQNVNAQIEELKRQHAIQLDLLDEKDLLIAEKDLLIEEQDREISALEEDKQAFYEEMIYVITGSIKTLGDISEQVLDLTENLEDFQMRNKHGVRSTAARTRHICQEMPVTVLDCAEHVTEKINYAQSALGAAFKEWKRAEAVLEMMQSRIQKQFMARILGKGEPMAPDHAMAPDHHAMAPDYVVKAEAPDHVVKAENYVLY